MSYYNYTRIFIGFCKYKANMNSSKANVLMKKPFIINNGLSSPLRKYSTQRIENTVHKTDRFPGGRVSNVKKDIDGMAFFLLLVPISTFCLGTWQVKRKKWKEDLIAGLMYKTKLKPVPLPTEMNEIHDMEFRRVTITGEFDHNGEMYLGPRSCLVDGESTYGGKLMSSAPNGASGYYVITPFIRSDTKERILVNRGWIPYPKKNPKTREEGQIKGEIEITGILRNTENPTLLSPIKKEDVRVWFVRDVEGMAEMIDGVPIFIDATVDSTVQGGPIGGQTRASLRNEHLSYIVTWYGLSATTALMWYLKYIK